MSKRRQIGLLHKGGWQLSTSIVGSNAVVYSKTSVASCVMVYATSLWKSAVPYITFAFTFGLGSLSLKVDITCLRITIPALTNCCIRLKWSICYITSGFEH